MASTETLSMPMPLSFSSDRTQAIGHSNWRTLRNQPLSKHSIDDLFMNVIPAIRIPQLLSQGECRRLGSYNKDVYPPIGCVGITQFDHRGDKETYFRRVNEARSLQDRFIQEAKVDVMARVRDALQQACGLPVRIAREGDKEYFAGLLRLINSSALIHADFAPFDGPSWEIGRITAQLSWNILLKQVQGGESIIYDRFWQGPSDDSTFKKLPPSYGYSPLAVEGNVFKVMQFAEGDLTLFNSRNFHEVKPIDNPQKETRYTMSSFVGFLPATAAGEEPVLVMWS